MQLPLLSIVPLSRNRKFETPFPEMRTPVLACPKHVYTHLFVFSVLGSESIFCIQECIKMRSIFANSKNLRCFRCCFWFFIALFLRKISSYCGNRLGYMTRNASSVGGFSAIVRCLASNGAGSAAAVFSCAVLIFLIFSLE